MKHSNLLTGFTALTLLLSSACSKAVGGDPGTPDPDPIPTPPVTAVTVTVTTIAGKLGDHGNAEDGIGAAARFWNPSKMVYDNRNNTLYVADGTTIRAIDQQNKVTTYMPLHTISNFNEIQDIDLAPGAGGSLYFTSRKTISGKLNRMAQASRLLH